MTFEDLAKRTQDAINVRRVFGDPYTSDGVTVIPVAAVGGGAGSGSGTNPDDGSGGEGGGFGGSGRPIGAYVIRDGEVSWRPAFDVNRAITGANLVLLALILLVSRVQRSRLRQQATSGPAAEDATVAGPAADAAADDGRAGSRRTGAARRRPHGRRRAGRRRSARRAGPTA
jgi:uncharacterized spore protein YtfJ